MSILFMQNELSFEVRNEADIFSTSDDIRTRITTDSAFFDPELSRCATTSTPNTRRAREYLGPMKSTVMWIHFHAAMGGTTAANGLRLINSADNYGLDITFGYSDRRLQITTPNGQAYYETVFGTVNDQIEVDFMFDHTTGDYEVYINDVLKSKARDTRLKVSSTLFAYVEPKNNSAAGLSQLVITDDEPTVGMRVATATVETLSDGTLVGEISNVNELGLVEGGMETTVAGPNAFAVSDLGATLMANKDLEVRAVEVQSVVTKSAASELKFAQPVFRIGGEYKAPIAPEEIIATSGARTYRGRLENNPVTGKPFTKDEINNLEAGVGFSNASSEGVFVPHLKFVIGVASSGVDYGYYKGAYGTLLEGGTWLDRGGNPAGPIKKLYVANNGGVTHFSSEDNSSERWLNSSKGVRFHIREADGTITTFTLPDTSSEYIGTAINYNWMKDRLGQTIEVMIEGYSI